MERLHADLFSKIERMANLGSYEVDMVQRTWTASNNLQRLFQLPQKPFYSIDDFFDLLHPEDRKNVILEMRDRISNQEDIELQYRFMTADKNILHVNSYNKMLYDENGRPTRGMGIIQDVTAQKKRELELEELIRLLHKKDKILGMVAHDLLTPISVVELYSSLLLDELENDQLELLEKQQEACSTAKNIVNDLIEFSRMKSSSFYLNLKHHDLNNLILDSVKRYRYQLSKKQLELHTDLQPRIEVKWDASKISRVLDNLLFNAIKFSEDGKRISIKTQLLGERIRLSISDQGIGIKEEYFPILFEQFSPELRRQGTKGESSTGLGLSIVKEIIDMHHGTIAINSKVNEGTTFTIEMDQYVEDSYPLQY